MSKIYAKIHPLMDELQYCMEHNIHLKDEDRVLAVMDKLSLYIAHLSDADRDYLHSAQDAYEEGRKWIIE
tara:strand:- start:1102 stop:1311 length:210 start_codon:yes stop_codon:yes gene_type:complete